MCKRHTGTRRHIHRKQAPRTYRVPADARQPHGERRGSRKHLNLTATGSSAPAPAEDVSSCKEPARAGLAKIRYLSSFELLQRSLEFRESL